MKIKIISDSASSIFELENVGYENVVYEVAPLKIVTDEKEYVDDKNLDVQQMVAELKTYKGRSGTACPGQQDWLDAFGEAEYIICITVTGKLSGSYNSARLAKEEYEEQHPERNVFILDSLSAGPGMRLLIEKARELSKTELSFKELCEALDEYRKHTEVAFSLESLRNLANNGRVNPAVAKIAGILGIRVVGRAFEGELQPNAKCRGEKGALAELMKEMKEYGYCGGRVIIDHCYNEDMAQKLKVMILELYPEADICIGMTGGLCSFYAEKGGQMIGFETK